MRQQLRTLSIATICGLLPLAAGAQTQGWTPSKPINLVVSVPPGSSTDILARQLAERLPAALGQSVVVTNRPGASGLIAAASVARSDADGHTLLLSPSTLFGAPHILPKGAGSGVDVAKDLVAVITTASSPLLILANPKLGVKTPQELIAHLKKHPGQPYASSGNGSPQHIGGQLFMKATDTTMTHVPYKGVMPAIIDTVGGQIDLAFGALGGVGQYIESGQLVAIAVAEAKRSSLLPEVPTLTESGINNVELNVFFPIQVPAGTPRAAIDRLNRDIGAIMQNPEVKEKMRALGVEALGNSVEAANQDVQKEYQRYAQIVAEFGLKEE